MNQLSTPTLGVLDLIADLSKPTLYVIIGSASLRKQLESHTGNGNLINQITQLGAKAAGSTRVADTLRAIAAREYDLKGVPRKSDDITSNLKRRARRLAVEG